MAQASSAQREPSMEEILASIRRIIEDSDQGRKPTEVEHHARFETAGEQRNEGAVIEVDAFRAELRGRVDRDQAPRLADPAPEDNAPAVEPPAVVTGVAREVPSSYQAGPSYDAGPSANGAEGSAFREALPVEAPDTADETAGQPNGLEVERRETPPAAAMAQPSSQELPHPVPRPAIISEQAGRQVAAAFGELSEAFAASRRRSFDEMAEEMLRPMLQDWLDNNLPTLVERLVREEIERVARGG